MILIEEILLTEEIANENFSCDLSVCKGACCSEGDFGAPLEKEEVLTIEQLMPVLEPYLSDESKAAIKDQGISPYYNEMKSQGTPLLKDESCAFLYKDKEISMCLFEKLFAEKKIDFLKPISCHLYPIRIDKNPQTGFISMHYDRWDICKPAILKGNKNKTPLYQFAKSALVRKYGQEFFDRFEQIATRSNG